MKRSPTQPPSPPLPSPAAPNTEPSASGRAAPAEVQAVSAALRLLETVAAAEGLGMSALSEQAGMTHNQTHRLLATLELNGYVLRDHGRRYHLGPRLTLYTQGTVGYRQLIEAAREPMNVLSALSGESILLAVRSNLDRVVIDRRLGTHSLRVDWAVGSRLPLHVGGLGVALLAFAPPEVWQQVLGQGRRAYTEHTLTGDQALHAELFRVRESGVRVSVDDYAVGEFSVAAPVLDARREAVAAVNIAGFTARLTGQRREEYSRAVIAAGLQITRELSAQ